MQYFTEESQIHVLPLSPTKCIQFFIQCMDFHIPCVGMWKLCISLDKRLTHKRNRKIEWKISNVLARIGAYLSKFSTWISNQAERQRERESENERAPPGIELMKNNCLHNIVFIKISKLMMHFSEIYSFQHKYALRFICALCIENIAHSFNFRLILVFFVMWVSVTLRNINLSCQEIFRNEENKDQISFMRTKNIRAHSSYIYYSSSTFVLLDAKSPFYQTFH